MSPKSLIGLIAGPPPSDLPRGLSAHEVRGWTVFLARPAFVPSRNRKVTLRRAEKRQIWLETLMRAGTVLPALPGTKIAPDALEAMIVCNNDLLNNLAERLVGRVQYQVILRCDLHEAYRVLAAQPGPFHGLSTPESLQTALADCVLNRLAALPGAEVTALPVTDDVVANFTLLLPEERVMTLDQAIEEIDAIWSEGFTLRQVGPSPAVSFASLGLKPVSLSTLNNALNCLGLDEGANLDTIRHARREALKQPGAAADQIREAAEVLVMASALDSPGPFHRVYVWAEGQTSSGTEAQAKAA